MTRDHGMDRPAQSGRTSTAIVGTVLGEEDVLEVRLAAHDVDDPVGRRGGEHGADRAGDPHPDQVAVGLDVADALERREDGRRDGRPERQLDMVEGKSADGLDASRPGRGGPRG